MNSQAFSQDVIKAIVHHIFSFKQPGSAMLKALLFAALVTFAQLVVAQEIMACSNSSDLAIGIVDFGFPVDIVSLDGPISVRSGVPY